MDRPLETLATIALLALSAVIPPIAAILAAPAAAGSAVVLVVGPDASGSVGRAGGRQIGPWDAPWGVLATGDAGFSDRARTAGAWRVVDGSWLAAICGERASYE